MLNLPNVTLVCIDTINPHLAIEAIEICKYYAIFGDIKFFSNPDVKYEHLVPITTVNSYKDYSDFMLRDLNKYITTDFILIVQWDGFILNPNAWTDEFFNYDYIGALLGPKVLPEIVGNGGFCLRSKKLLEFCEYFVSNFKLNFDHSEDLIICYLFRDIFEESGIKFAPKEIAEKFSSEREEEWHGAFGFHNYGFVEPIQWGWVHPFKPGWRPYIKKYFDEIEEM